MRPSSLTCTALVLVVNLAAMAGADTVVHFDTSLGTFDVQLYDTDTPVTVDNFLRYVGDGDYTDSFFHRLASGFVLQGGGFRYDIDGDEFSFVPTDAPIVNEFQHSNVRGTIAMAKLEGDPDSATSQFFINLDDNSANLDVQNGGFTVFGHVMGDGMDVVDRLVGAPPNPDNVAVWNASAFYPAFGSLPLIDYINDGRSFGPYLEMVNSITVVPNEWECTGNGSYHDPANWTFNTVPNGAGAVANFLEKTEGNTVVTVDPGVTVGTIRFRSPEAHPEYRYTIDGTETIKLEASGGPQIIVERGDHTISAPLSLLSPGLTVDTADGTVLRIEPAQDFSSLKGTVTKTGTGSLILGPRSLVAGPLNVNGGVLEAGEGVLGWATPAGPPRTITLGAMATLKASGHVNGLVVDTGGMTSPSTLQAVGPMMVGVLGSTAGYNYAGILNADTHPVVLLDDDKADVGLALIGGGSLTGAKGIQLVPVGVGFGGFITGDGEIHGVVTAGTPGNPAVGFGGTPPGITIYGDVIGLWNQFDNTTVTGILHAGFSPAHNPLGPGSNAGTAQFLIGGPLDGEVTFNSATGEYEKTTGDHTQFLVYGVAEGQPAGAPTVFESLELKLDADFPDFGWDDLAAGDDIVLIQTGPWQTVQWITLPPHFETTLVGPGQVEYGSSFEGDLQSALDLIRPKLATGLDVTYAMNESGLALHIVPEPGTLALLLSGGLALLVLVWRRRRGR